jgi:hypothetical protein
MFQALADSVKKVTVYQSLLCGCPVVPFSDASASPVRGIRPTGQPTKGIQLSLRVKNWEKHQHFKDRRPPWVKLYRDLLENPDWHYLSGDDAKLLVALWLIASEDETKTGLLPDVKRIAFRLRSTEKQINQQLTRLSEWLIHDDINVISERYQFVSPETETETETETENRGRDKKAPAAPLPDWLQPTAWDDFKAHRKAAKSAMTPRAEALAIAELTKLRAEGHDPTAVINQSISRGWKGLFAINGNGQTKEKNYYERLAEHTAILTGQHKRKPSDDPGFINGTAERVD